MPSLRSQISRGVGLAAYFVVLTWLFFAPVASFHHIIACGVLAPVVLNGESPQGDHLICGEYEVRFFPRRFALSATLWLASLVVAFNIMHSKPGKAEPGKSPPNPPKP